MGIFSGDTVTLGGTATGSFASANIGTSVVVGIAGFTLAGAASGNYSLTQPFTAANITAKGLTVTGTTAANKVYDANTTATVNQANSVLVGVISGDTVTLGGTAAGTFASANVGTSIVVTIGGFTLAGAASGNYSLTQPFTAANITAKGLTVTGTTAANKVYDANTTATVSQVNSVLVGVISGDTVTLGGTATGSFASANIGTSIVVAVAGFNISGGSSANYSLTQPTTTANITAKGIGEMPLVVSPGVGESEAVIYNSDNQVRARLSPMGSWTGGMRSAVGDVTGDGFADFLFAAGPGGGPRIVVIDGVSLKQISSFFAYASTFRGGIYISAGDLNGDGVEEIVTGAGATGGPHVQSFNAFGVKAFTGFYAYATNYTGGVTVATGDLNGDNIDEIITGAATNGGSNVRSFSANGVRNLNFFAYSPSFMGGVNVAAGDINGDGIDEVITGPGATGAPNVKVFDANANQLASFFAYSPSFTGGVTVGTIDPTNRGTFQIVTGPGSGGPYYPGPAANLYGFNGQKYAFITSIVAYGKAYTGGIWVS